LALPKLQSCLKADPREPRTLFLLARALEQLGQKEKAVSVLKELARLYQDLGRWNEREAAIARALAMVPADAELRAMAAVRDAASDTGVDVTPPPSRNLDAPQAAANRFDSGGTRGAGRVAVPLGVGETSARLVSAVGEAEDGSAAPPDVARILAESDVFVKYGMLERAADHLARVFELEPENREARDMLIAVFQQLGRPVDAARHLDILAQQLARTDPAAAQRAAGKARFLDPQGTRPRTAGPPAPPSGRPRSSVVALDAPEDDPRASQATPAPVPTLGLSGPSLASASIPIEAEPSLEIVTDFEQSIGTGDVVFVQESASARAGVSLEAPRARQLDVTTPPPVRLGAPRGLDLSVTPPPVLTGADAGPDLATPPPVVATRARQLDAATPPPVVRHGLDLDAATPPPVLASARRGFDLSTTPPPVLLGGGDESAPPTPPPVRPDFGRGLDATTPPPEMSGALPGRDLITPPPALHNAALDRTFEGFSGGAVSLDFEGGPSTLEAGFPGDARETGADDDELIEELNQVDFFMDQGMPDEARSILEDLAARFPRDPRVMNRLRDLDGGVRSAAPLEISGAQPVAAFPIDDRQGTPAPRAVIEGGSGNDASTRIDLAIAYKEMGLFDAAIAELRPMVDTPNEVLALTMMGECFEAKGSFTEAVIRYKGALNCTPIRPEEVMQLYFLLGAAFERLGDPSEALYFFEKVARREPHFRDVAQRIHALKPKLAKAAP
ncbi:MAG TPA: tetratricopeptide repeat protein, partial [Polyangia bacterium]|nr:tetratricopeptide repeat protein [Polyangia bacterium]